MDDGKPPELSSKLRFCNGRNDEVETKSMLVVVVWLHGYANDAGLGAGLEGECKMLFVVHRCVR